MTGFRALIGLVRALLSLFCIIAAIVLDYGGDTEKATYLLVWAVLLSGEK